MDQMERRVRAALTDARRDAAAPTAEEVLDDIQQPSAEAWPPRQRRPDASGTGRRLYSMVGAAAAVAAVIGGVAWFNSSSDAPSPGADEPAAVATQRDVTVYLADRDRWRLVPQSVETRDTGNVGVDSMRALLTTSPDDPGLYNGFNLFADYSPAIDINSVTTSASSIVVDLTRDLWDPYPAYDLVFIPSGRAVAQQLVWTLQTNLQSALPVTVTVNGELSRGFWLDHIDWPVSAEPLVRAGPPDAHVHRPTCREPAVSLVSPTGVTNTSSLRLRLGETVRVRVTGPCADQVGATAQNNGLNHIHPLVFEAVSAGTTEIVLTMPMCLPSPLGDPLCAGGIDSVARLSISVSEAGR